MENTKQILLELDDGFEYFAIKKDGKWNKIEFDSFMVKNDLLAQNVCKELNYMLKSAMEDCVKRDNENCNISDINKGEADSVCSCSIYHTDDHKTCGLCNKKLFK